MNCDDIRPRGDLPIPVEMAFSRVSNALRQRHCAALATVVLSAGFFANTAQAQLDHYRLDAESMTQWRLPDRLNEISGLALTADDRLLAVDDEVAIIYELDYSDGRIVKAFALGKPIAKGDFEGLAVVADLVYLTTSAGRVYVAAEAADGQRVAYDTYDTGLGKKCEIEGLASGKSERLYFLCKNMRGSSRREGLMVFAWDTSRRELRRGESFVLPEKPIMRRLRLDRISPSGLAFDGLSGHWVIIAGRQRALIELSSGGAFVNARFLPLANRHRRAEGVELAVDGGLLISDEGGTHKARLAVYRKGNVDDKQNE